jgi:hypothetical protein
MASATTPEAGTAVTSLRWLIALAGSPVRTSTVASARGTVEIGFIATRTLTGSPEEAVANFNALHRVNAHHRPGEPPVESPVPVHVAAETGRQAMDDDLDDAAKRVAILAGRFDFGDHLLARGRVEAADRIGVDN